MCLPRLVMFGCLCCSGVSRTLVMGVSLIGIGCSTRVGVVTSLGTLGVSIEVGTRNVVAFCLQDGGGMVCVDLAFLRRWRLLRLYSFPFSSSTMKDLCAVFATSCFTVACFHSFSLVPMGCILTVSPGCNCFRSFPTSNDNFLHIFAWFSSSVHCTVCSFVSDVGRCVSVRLPSEICAGLLFEPSWGVFL